MVRLVLALTFVVGSALLFSSTDKPAYRMTDKAYYADANTVSFVRPGLVIKITEASVASDGTVKARFKITDPKGLGLDINGVTTPGAVSTRFVIGTIPAGKTQYTSYLVRKATNTASGRTADQATYDSGGTIQAAGDGQYIYTFKNKLPATFDRHATHTIGVWAARDLSEFELDSVRNYDSNVYSWVPDGSAVTVTRDVIRTQSCEKCHTEPFTAHDERHGIELCVICHQPQSADPDSGNTVDMPVMIHKIHMGAELPSVKAGKPYQIIGYGNSVQDYSHVEFPADARNCTFCHEQTTGAAQANAYLKPTRAACGACHDNVNFATGQGHVNLPQISDNQCANCHIPQGDLEFDASIKGAHTIPRFSNELAGLVAEITSVTGAGPGKNPTFTFSVRDKKGNPLDVSKVTRLNITVAGPSSDYAKYVSEDVRSATGSGGVFTYTLKSALPADAKGTFTAGLEGYNNGVLMAGTTREQTVRDATVNKTFDFSVDGSPVQKRRQIVSIDKCNNCHFSLSLHGDNRNQIEQCVLCHNPNESDKGTRPADKQPAQTVQFAHMIHRIHTGEASTQEYTIYGRGGSANDFTEIRYPGDRRNCQSCHVNGSEQLPLNEDLLQVQSARTPLNPMGPATAACTGCHTDIASASHMLSNTTEKLGEACAACHSSTASFGVSKSHAR
ncbi:MAG: OmcA/MtrC family decaheme c-type cytochrome [Acidobacteriota bacterium]